MLQRRYLDIWTVFNTTQVSRLQTRSTRRLQTLRRIPDPGPEQFRRQCLQITQAEQKPVLLQGLAKEWPAIREGHSKWSKSDNGGKETLSGMRSTENETLLVPVELSTAGQGYLDKYKKGSSWSKVEMPFGLFLDAFIAKNIPDNSAEKTIGYLAQYDLLDASPVLQRSILSVPHILSGPNGDKQQYQRNVWIGPENTWTPAHSDPYHNMFVQVVGTKRFYLFPPTCAQYLYLSDNPSQRNTSKVPMSSYPSNLTIGTNPVSADYPLFAQALENDQAFIVQVEPGDGLFLPLGWFHAVQSLSTSASVNFWWR